MHCDEAKRRMNETPGAFDAELKAHLAECHACARHAEAARLLERLFTESGHDEPMASFSTVRDRVNMKFSQLTYRERFMSQIKENIRRRPRLLTGLGFTAVILCLAVLVPFSFSHTVGWKIAVEGIGADAAPSSAALTAAFAAAGLEDVSVSTQSDGALTEYLLGGGVSRAEAGELAEAIGASTGDDSSRVRVRVEPVVSVKSGSLIAELFRPEEIAEDTTARFRFDGRGLRINGTKINEFIRSSRLTDEEVKDSIEEILARGESGSDSISVTVETADNGITRLIEIRAHNILLSRSFAFEHDQPIRKLSGVYDVGDDSIPESGMILRMTPAKDDGSRSRGVVIKIQVDKEP